MIRLSLSLIAIPVLAAGLAGCGGMNRAVTTVPKTFDDLGAQTAAFRGERAGDAAAGSKPIRADRGGPGD